MEDFFYRFPAEEPLKISEKAPEGYGRTGGYTKAGLVQALGAEDWFLAYTVHSNGAIEGLNENSTYSISIRPGGGARIRNYILTKDPITGKLSTLEDSQPGIWEVSGRSLSIALADEKLEFTITCIEHGVAQMVDPDCNAISVFMTAAAFKVALRNLLET